MSILRIGQVIEMRDGTWRIDLFCEEPNTGLVVLMPMDPPRAKGVCLPTAWLRELLELRERCGSEGQSA